MREAIRCSRIEMNRVRVKVLANKWFSRPSVLTSPVLTSPTDEQFKQVENRLKTELKQNWQNKIMVLTSLVLTSLVLTVTSSIQQFIN